MNDLKFERLSRGNLCDDIKLSDYVYIQAKAIKYLFLKFPSETVVLTVTLLILSFNEYVSLRYVQFVTDAISSLYKNTNTAEFIIFLEKAVVFLVTLFLFWGISAFLSFYRIKFDEKVSYTIEKELNIKLSHIDYEYYESNQFHEQLEKVKGIVQRFSSAIEGYIFLSKTTYMMISYTILLKDINHFLPFAIIGASFFSLLLSIYVSRKQVKYYDKLVLPSSRKRGYFQYLYSDKQVHQTIQSGRLHKFFLGRFIHWNTENSKAYMKMDAFKMFIEIFVLVIQFGVSAVVLLYVGARITAGTIGIGAFTLSITLLVNCFDIIRKYASFISNSSFFVRTLACFFSIMESDDGISTDSNLVVDTLSLLSLNKISYTYPQSDKLALIDVSLNLSPGEKVCIVGENGSGKSTLANIISGLLNGYNGDYYIGNHIKKRGIVSGVTCLFQDFGEYQLTIKENIELGNHGNELSEEAVIDILKKVELLDFVNGLENGLYTKLGNINDGIELSKGQWQRIAIARLLANENSAVWILDEPTAYLDPLAEIEFYKLVDTYSQGRMVIFISHRLGYTKNANRIIVMSAGKIVEEGNHHQLMKQKGKYFEMYSAQMTIFES